MSTCSSEYRCPVEATLELIGGKYKTLILWHLIGKTLRFGEISALIPQAILDVMCNWGEQYLKNK